jgi:hemerythrin-like domain-containing protein
MHRLLAETPPMAKRKNAIELLEEDHEKVEHLLEKLTDTSERGTKTRTKLIHDLQKEIEVHTQIENEIFYPAFRTRAQHRDDEEIYFEAREEHQLVSEFELPQILEMDPGTVQFAAKARLLKELIRHHIEEERESMFPRVRALFDEEELEELGERLKERKRELLEERRAA